MLHLLWLGLLLIDLLVVQVVTRRSLMHTAGLIHYFALSGLELLLFPHWLEKLLLEVQLLLQVIVLLLQLL